MAVDDAEAVDDAVEAVEDADAVEEAAVAAAQAAVLLLASTAAVALACVPFKYVVERPHPAA